LAIVLAFLAMLIALLVWCAMHWLEKRFVSAGAIFVLAMLSVVIAVLLGVIWGGDSLLASTLGDPMLYSGPVGWLAGCAKIEEPTQVPEAVEATRIVKETVVVEVEKEVETEVTKVVEKEVQVTTTPVPTPVPTATPFPQPTPTAQATHLPVTATPQPRPTQQPTVRPTLLPPPLLGQFRPETIYWAPELLTDQEGQLRIDVPLPEFATTWRLTAFASTRQGQLGTEAVTLVVK
jgi:hypothetical protein